MKKLSLILLCVLGLSLVACGDDDDDTNIDAGTDGDTDTDSDTDSDADTDSDSDSDSDADLEDECLNDEDMAILGNPENTLEEAIGGCAFMCMSESDIEACLQECIQDETGLSADCTACFVMFLGCSMANCSEECVADPDSVECEECQDEFCWDAFEVCTGELPEPPADGGVDGGESDGSVGDAG